MSNEQTAQNAVFHLEDLGNGKMKGMIIGSSKDLMDLFTSVLEENEEILELIKTAVTMVMMKSLADRLGINDEDEDEEDEIQAELTEQSEQLKAYSSFGGVVGEA